MWWRLERLRRWTFVTVGIPLLRIVAPLFFEPRYLQGRHFEPAGEGWRWVLRSILTQRILSYNRHIPWPVSPFMSISSPLNIDFDPDDLNNFQMIGSYFQNFGARIVIGKGSYIAPNVGLITTNHDTADPSRHLAGQEVVIGPKCWIGMNAVILPGVTLGENTVVGAGAVVTRSYPDGHVVLAGAPARVIKTIRT